MNKKEVKAKINNLKYFLNILNEIQDRKLITHKNVVVSIFDLIGKEFKNLSDDWIGKKGIDWGTEDGQPGKDFDPMCNEEVIKEPAITGTKKEFMELNTDHNWRQAYKTDDGRELYGYGPNIRSWENDFEKIIEVLNKK